MRSLYFVILILTFLSVQAKVELPNNYKSLSACEKQEVLWSHVEESEYRKLPKYNSFGFFDLLGMFMQKLSKKTDVYSDIAEKDWKKYLHPHGSMAKVKFSPVEGSQYTGIFEGADCALLRLSLTYKVTKKRPFAPGLAFKVLRDGAHSANISALYTMDGQDRDHNFFKNPLSNIVPIGKSFGHKVVHAIFERISAYPEELMLTDMAKYSSKGEKEQKVVSPRQIFFVPNQDLKLSSKEHDVRNDFHKIAPGTLLYKVYAVNESKKDYNYYNYEVSDIAKFVSESKYIGDIVSTSNFISSKFGDKRILFKHETR